MTPASIMQHRTDGTSITADGSNLQETQCPKDGSGGVSNCFAAYLALHLTPLSSAYLEVCARLYSAPAFTQTTLLCRVRGSGSLITIWMAMASPRSQFILDVAFCRSHRALSGLLALVGERSILSICTLTHDAILACEYCL